MIIDVPQIEHGLVEKIQELLDTLPISHPKRKYIEADLHKMLSGNSGEKDVAYHLRFWYKDDQDVVVVNNLRLEYNDRTAQIDHLVAVPSGFLVMESKSLPQKIVISDDGNWYRVKEIHGKEVKEGMYNPVEQNRRHIAVLKDILAGLKINPVPLFANIVVLTNPRTIIEKPKSKDSYYIVRTDQLRACIERFKSISLQKNMPSPTSIINEIIKYHKPATIDIYRRYNIDPKETMPIKERIKFDITKKSYICVFCNNPMILQKNRNGLFWGCSNYPQCKNLVPASVAAQVGQETREEYIKKLNFFTALFSSDPPKLCPVCGGVLELKKGRKGEYWECSNKQLCKYKKW